MRQIIILSIALLLAACNIKAVETEVKFENSGVTFGGTLAMPDSVGKFPAIVMVTGSGQQDRNEKIFGFKPFKVISDSLVKMGFAVLRFDDRGIGASASGLKSLDTSTTYTFAYDALCAIRFLEGNKNIDSKKIGIFGHSEGGMIAYYLAAEFPSEVAFIISMSGPTVSPQKIINYQIEYANLGRKLPKDGIKNILDCQNRVYRAIENDKPADTLEKIFYDATIASLKYMTPQERTTITDTVLYAKFSAKHSIAEADIPWFRAFVKYNPEPILKKVNCRVLALFGSKDQQVPVAMNLPALKSAFSDRKKLLTVKVIPNANHLFQAAKTGAPAEYSKLPKAFAPGFFDAVNQFLVKSVKNK